MGRNVGIDVFRGWGILFIVLGHIVGAGSHLSIGLAQDFCTAGYKYFYAFHVPLFFVVAGMTFRQLAWKDFLIRRTRRLLIPYFIFGLVSIALYWLVCSLSTQILQGSDTTGYYIGKAVALPLWQMVTNLVLGGWWPLGFVANGVLWFIPVLFAVEIVAQGCSRICKTWWLWWLLAAVAFIGMIYLPIPKLPWGFSPVPKYLPYFIIGLLIGPREIQLRKDVLLGLSLFLIIVFGGLAIWNPWQWYERTLGLHLLSIAVTLGNIAGWWGLSRVCPWHGIAQCGIWSLGIMLLHKFPVLFVQNTLAPVRNLFTQGLFGTLLGIGITFILSLGMTLLACWLLLRYVPFVLGAKKRAN